MVNIKDLIAKQPEVLSVLKQIGKIADEVNKEVYGVGGVVRDLILDRKIKEVDLMVIGDGIEFARLVLIILVYPKLFHFISFLRHISLTNLLLSRLLLRDKRLILLIRESQKQ